MTRVPSHRPVAAVITDGPEALVVARCAARVALAQGRPLLVLVPMVRPPFTLDATIVARMYERADWEARAIAARVHPFLEIAGIPGRVQVVWHRARWADAARGAAVSRAALTDGAVVLVTPLQLPITRGVEVLRVNQDAASARTADLTPLTPGLTTL